ncbi:MAG: type II toxin-antitoxin system HicB family antitoxin [Polyangiaceae bacterium]|nr:type II toxin-antitoxin system HicB family antitoxin [Polyangiaceae bacterium]
MKSGRGVRVVRQDDGKLAARLPGRPECVGYGTTDVEAIAELFAVRTELEGHDAPRLRPADDGGWWAESARHPGCTARGETPAEAIAAVRRMEERWR